MSGIALQQAEGAVLFTVVFAYGFAFLLRKFRRTRPDFRVGRPLVVGFAARLAAIVVIGATGLDSALRGGDETTFLDYARGLATQPLGRGDLPHGHFQLHTILFTLQLKLGFISVGTLRITQVAIAMLGALLIITAVNDLASARAARITAWLLALDPTGIFFNSALHKEPNMELAAGLVVFGGTMLWRRLDIRGILICALGGLIAVETRSYAGWFLVAGSVLVLLHAALRHSHRPLRALPAVYAVLAIAVVATPAILQASSTQNLKKLQQAQTANASGVGVGPGVGGDNLALEQVNYSTRGAIFSNLPKRVVDLITRPYPWQLADTSQRVGAVGTLIAYAIFLLLLVFAASSGGRVMRRAGPFLYPALFLLIAYSLSAGNAGTGFRYRSSIMPLVLAAVVVLRHHVIRDRNPALASAHPPPPQSMRGAWPAAVAAATVNPAGASRR